MSKLNTVLCALAFALVGSSTQLAHAATTRTGNITKVQAYKDAMYFQMTGLGAAEGCAGSGWGIFPNSGGASAFAQQASYLLSAHLSGRTVTVTFSGCAASPSGGALYPHVQYFDINAQ